MKNVGDIITWQGKSGKMTGEIVGITNRVRYTVLVEPERKQVVLITEIGEPGLALTWEDAQRIFIITQKVMSEFDKNIALFNSTQEMYEEVLRRFKEDEK